MNKKGKYDKLIRKFEKRPIFTRDELWTFFRKDEPELKEATFTWRIYDLKRRNIINDLKKGIYTLNHKTTFEPKLNEQIITIGKIIDREYNPDFYNIWDTIWLNDFIELQATNSLTVLEAEKEQMESIFFSLRNEGFADVFIKPDEGILERHVSEATHPIIIKPFVSRSPIRLLQEIRTPTLEKILVDLYCDDLIYFGFQGHQLLNIYRNATSGYTLNFSKLLTYAKRRNREDEIKDLLLQVSGKDLKKIIE